MTWEEHEAVYCKEICPRREDIYDEFDSYYGCENFIDNYEQSEENQQHLITVKCNDRYYAISLTSLESEVHYQYKQ